MGDTKRNWARRAPIYKEKKEGEEKKKEGRGKKEKEEGKGGGGDILVLRAPRLMNRALPFS